MKKLMFVALAALVLAGCPALPPEPQPPATIEPVEPVEPNVPTPPPPPDQVPTPPKVQSIDWSASVQPLLGQMLGTEGIDAGSILLLDSVKNTTNGTLAVSRATTALYDALAKNPKFTLVTPGQLSVARQTLGLSEGDSLGSRSKAIGLARYVSAQYVLYTDVSGDVKSPSIGMQLMLVQTGEIIWSGHGQVQL